ncbi:3-oxoacyl-acyl carrier protein reductase [Penicillium brasilianum]|uniref:3-oxoacyl-acyl carrier protein reductase n=1 Tax=Penicillium brasilianum TaxID=104259 RepID=A0A1S9RT93_PENBI|nr:3-oxoacyl-acyl carrier protein reductase [Penicillium brasilianum]
MAARFASWSRLRAPASSLVCSRPTYDIRRISPAIATTRGNALFYSSTPPDIASPVADFQPANRLSGRTCMVTGGASGIGFAIAERFLQEGASRVILVGRSQERLQKAAEKLSINDGTETSSEKVRLVAGDVGEAGTWMRELEKEMAGVDVLVNAAGVSISNILPKLELADISQILRTNLEGAILTSRAFLRAAIRSRIRDRKSPDAAQRPPSKCIINVSSLLALKAGTGAVPYAASKAGLLGLTRSLAVESTASMRDIVVRSNAIVPGYIETPMIEDFSPGEVDRLKATIPLRRFGDPREIADAAVFLAQNEYANNCVLNLDGGLSAV